METTLIVNPKEFGLEENKALELTSGLTTILTERETLKNAYLDVIDLEVSEENLATFKELRLKIVKNRTQGIEKWHKTSKEFFLTGGRFVDAIKNKESAENDRMESNLLDKEKHFENLEKARLKVIHEDRISKLLPFNYEVGNIDFSAMDDNMFNAILLGAETNHNNRIATEKLAEEQRLEALRLEAEEREKQKAELERLRVENEAKDKAAKLAKELADKELAELKAKADLEAKKQAEILAKQKAESNKLAAELKAKADSELKEKQRIEAESKAKIEADKKAAKAPDKDKLLVLINSMNFNNTELKSTDALALQNLINQKFDGFKKWAIEQINTL